MNDGRRAPLQMEMAPCLTTNHPQGVIHDPRGFDWVTSEGEFCWDCENFYEDCECNPKKISQRKAN